MDSNKRKALVAAGWTVGDAADFLELNEEERQLLDARMQLAAAIRQARASSNLSQKELGQRLSTSQPRVAKIERAAPDVSLDQLVRAFVAAGGNLVVKSKVTPKKRGAKTGSARTQQVIIETSTAE